MTIGVGDKLPEATLFQMTGEGPAPVTIEELTAGKKVVIFALPGAFTPTCSAKHVPGFLAARDALSDKGVDAVACVSVNDAFVMGAWAKEQGTGDKILMLGDGAGAFTRAIGMELDLSGHGLGVRSKRYSMVVENGVVTALNIEPNPGEANISGAEHLLGQL